MLTQSETYFKKVNIHIIQCDDRVREDVAITSAETLKSYMERLTINGCGGTDFRRLSNTWMSWWESSGFPGLRDFYILPTDGGSIR